MSNELDDVDLLRRTSTEPEFFGVFYRRHERLIFGYFMSHVRDLEISADLTAETFAAALSAAPRFTPGPTPVSAWLVAIAHNKLVSSRRRGAAETRARQRLNIEPLVLSDAAIERAEAQIDDDRFPLESLLATLPPDQQDAVRAYVLDEDTYEEISRDSGRPEAAIRQRVSRGLRSLRRQLEGDNS